MDAATAYAPEVARASAILGVPELLIRAVMRNENAGADTMALVRESDGEFSRGLMMVKHGTARELGLANPLQLHDPWTGIYYGTLYLAKQLARYKGKVADAIAAYNAGSVRRTSSGAYINQGYVDRALAYLRAAGSSFSRENVTPLALGIAIVATIAIVGASRRRKGAA